MQPIASYFFFDCLSCREQTPRYGQPADYIGCDRLPMPIPCLIGWCLTQGPSGSGYPQRQGLDHTKKKFKKPSLLLFYAYIATDCIL